jgi:hypothetical protein
VDEGISAGTGLAGGGDGAFGAGAVTAGDFGLVGERVHFAFPFLK